MMSYAFISLTPVWCEINVFLFFLFIFFFCYFFFIYYFVYICYYIYFLFLFVIISILIYTCLFFFSNTIRPRTNVKKCETISIVHMSLS